MQKFNKYMIRNKATGHLHMGVYATPDLAEDARKGYFLEPKDQEVVGITVTPLVKKTVTTTVWEERD